jgi:fumarate reductase flavoprotein subunit
MRGQAAGRGSSRRTFLAKVGAGALGVASSGALAAQRPARAEEGAGQAAVAETLDCDVLVIGGGASGCCAAIRAAEEGAKVILVEKGRTLGGCFNLSFAATTYGSRFGAGQPPSFGIPDLEAYISAWLANSHWRCDAAAVRQLVVNSGKAYDWLADKGLGLTPFGGGSGMLMLPDYAVRPVFWKEKTTAAVEKSGGRLMLSAAAQSLVKEGAAVVGAVVRERDGGTTRDIRVNAKAVSISTGGYAGNPEMVREAVGFDVVNGSLPQNVGEGLRMAWEAGAWKPRNFGGQMLHQTIVRATNSLAQHFEPFPAKYPLLLAYLPMTLNVGTSGLRFRDEALILDPVAASNSSAYQGPHHYVIASKRLLDALAAGGLAAVGQTSQPGLPPEMQPPGYTPATPWKGVYDVFDKGAQLKVVFKGDTPAKLAGAAGMDEAAFVRTFGDYRRFTLEKKDAQFGKAPAFLLDYGEEGPLYAVKAEVNNLGSFGGIQTSLRYEALTAAHRPVPGLYATGSEAGSNLYNDTYVGSGIGLANAVTSGYLCGKAMADYALGRK